MRSLSSAGEPVASVTTSAARGAFAEAAPAVAGPKSYRVFGPLPPLDEAQPASRAAAAMTKTGSRRCVKCFMAVLMGLFVVLRGGVETGFAGARFAARAAEQDALRALAEG